MPQSYFPQFLASKAMSQLPFSGSVGYKTITVDMPSGPRHAYSMYGAGLTGFPTNPLARYEHTVVVTDAELTTLRNYFEGRNGMLEEFIYLDPSGNLLEYSEDFSQAFWAKNSVTVGAAQTDPFGGSLATLLTASSTNSNINAYCLPLGDASGMVLTASVYVKALSGGTSLLVGFIDSGFGVLSSQSFSLPNGVWTRLSHTTTLATNSNIRILIGGLGTWNMSSLHMFGAQVSAMPAAGGYAKSPACWGYKAKCRFNTDQLKWRKLSPNQNQVTYSIQEIY